MCQSKVTDGFTPESLYNDVLNNEYSLLLTKTVGPELNPIVFHVNHALDNDVLYNETFSITNEF